MKKKKQNKQGGNKATIATTATSMEKPSNKPRKVKFPCKLCKGGQLLKYCPHIPQVLEVWSTVSHQPLSLASGDHVGD